jgi:hypothetical protein
MMPTLYIVYCIDTEGPLYESIEATFERIRSTFGIDIKSSKENLKLLQEGKNPKGYKIPENISNEIKKFASPKLLAYNNDWHDLDNMWEVRFSEDFRSKDVFRDDSKNGLIYNFFIMDHVGFSYNNPRRRSYGYHIVFDYYTSLIKNTQSKDRIYWHFHPIHFTKDAHRSASSYTYSWDTIHEIIARKIIDRDFFPCGNRPGFHTERPDIHNFLEMWIPFDYANQSMIKKEEAKQMDVTGGRFGDWRRAPSDWGVYHPNHDDYQSIGNCRRTIGKCLNIGTRLRTIDEDEIRAAFMKAKSDGRAILSFANHDWRDIKDDLISVYKTIKKVKEEFPDVKIINSSAGDAMRDVLFENNGYDNFDWDINYVEDKEHIKVEIDVKKETPFGPQPFLAIKTVEGRYYHDNFDIQLPFKKFSYMFDDYTIDPKVLDTVGIGTCDEYGHPHIIKVYFETGKIKEVKKVRVDSTFW